MDLHLNQEKSLLFIPLDGNALLNTIPNEIPVSRIGFELLGCPIGSQVFCEESLIRKIKRVRRCLEHLPDLEDAQMEMALLRSCLYLPKLVYCLCTCSLTDIQAATMAFDKLMRASLESIIGGSLPDWSWLKASLPNSTGGLSLRGAFLHAPAVFNLSYLQQCSIYSTYGRKMQGFQSGLPSHLFDMCASVAKAAGRSDWISLQDIDV